MGINRFLLKFCKISSEISYLLQNIGYVLVYFHVWRRALAFYMETNKLFNVLFGLKLGLGDECEFISRIINLVMPFQSQIQLHT